MTHTKAIHFLSWVV